MDTEWELQPLGGETGQAYMGVKAQERIFVKRNATPFLAAVSTEGIAPKMLWTKRTVHGEVLIAQIWIDARVLRADEMVQLDILNIIKYVHHSEKLLGMLQRIQGDVCMPKHFLDLYETELQHDLRTHSFLNQIVAYLKRTATDMNQFPKRVCHGDLNHRNFLLDANNRLYLVDWENVKIADPLSDVAAILCQYVAFEDWMIWLEAYGIDRQSPDFFRRLEWYCLHHCLMMIKKSHFQGNYHHMNRNIVLIKNILKRFQ